MPLDFPNTPTNGQVYEKYKWNATDSVWDLNLPEYIAVYEFEYLVIAGGGGGDTNGGAGSGGYRSSVSGELSGGGAPAESALTLFSDNYTITVGAGGPQGFKGSDSSFYSITSYGGSDDVASINYGSGVGAGNGGAVAQTGQSGTAGQGSDGGDSTNTDGNFRISGGGGGAGSAGLNGGNGNGVAGNGGAGISSSITGSAVFRGGGGGGHAFHNSNPGLLSGGDGGNGGGGQGQYVSPNDTEARPSGNGVANTGGGGGAAVAGQFSTSDAGIGGSGIVILKYPNTASLSIPAGLTAETDDSTVPGYKITTFTAGTGTITVI